MKQRKLWFGLVAILLLGMALAACGGGGNNNADTADPTVTDSDAGANEAAVDEPEPTDPPPTDTPEPTSTPEPTATPEPEIALTPFESAEGGFAISYPEDWFTSDLFGLTLFASSEELLDAAEPGEEGALALLVAGTVEEIGASDPIEILNTFVAEFDLQDGEVVAGPTAMEINGLPGATIQLTATAAEDETPLTAWAFTAVNDGRAGVFIALTPTASAAEFGPVFQAMAETLTVSATVAAAAPEAEPTAVSEPATNGDSISQWASGAVASTEYTDTDWSALQATGAPDTAECGDITTAWASAGGDTVDTLELYYDTPVFASEVHIYQTYNPDQVVLVEALGVGGEVEELFSQEPVAVSEPCPYILTISGEPSDFAVNAIRITVDQSVLGLGWNEIDAVELIGAPAGAAAGDMGAGGAGELTVAFVQDGTEVAYVFFVENDSQEMAIEDSDYTVTLYDESGSVLETGEGYLELMLPGSEVVVADSVYVDDGVTVNELEINFAYGDEVTVELPADFLSIATPNYYPDEYFSQATALLSNSFAQTITDVRVNAVAYDAAGNIVGSGYTFVDFVPAGGDTGVSVLMTVAAGAEVATVAFSPLVTSLSDAVDPGDEGLNLLELGFGQDEFGELAYGFLLENSSETTLSFSTYQVTVFDAEGNVLEAGSGFLDTIFGGETLGVGDSLFMPEGAVADRVLVQVLDGREEEHDVLNENPFTTEESVFVADDFFPQVTGNVVNAYGETATDLYVYALLYDADGNIIGAGFTFVDEVPGGGVAPFEVTVALETEAVVDSVQTFATLSSLTELGGE